MTFTLSQQIDQEFILDDLQRQISMLPLVKLAKWSRQGFDVAQLYTAPLWTAADAEVLHYLKERYGLEGERADGYLEFFRQLVGISLPTKNAIPL